MRKILALLVAAAAVAAVAIPATAATRSVAVRDFRFSPTTLTVHRGTVVKWVWRGRTGHNVTVRRGPVKFHSRTITRGSFSHRMTRRGTYHIVCTIHPGMDMTLRVR